MRKELILIVDDEAVIADEIAMQLEELGLDVCGTAATAEEALRLATLHQASIVIMDMRLQGELDGVHAALAINETVGSKIIFLTGDREPMTIERIQIACPSSVLFKPVSTSQLSGAINAARSDETDR